MTKWKARANKIELKYPYTHYSPGRFQRLAGHPLSLKIWEVLANFTAIEKMIQATVVGKTAIAPLTETLDKSFTHQLEHFPFADLDTSPDDFKIFVNNMVKQIMEWEGYEHSGCGMLPGNPWVNLSGVYSKVKLT